MRGAVVAPIAPLMGGSLDMDRRDAAFVVHACNAYPQLIDALKAAGGYLRNARLDLETGTKRAGLVTIDGGLKVIEAALQLAEREKGSGL